MHSYSEGLAGEGPELGGSGNQRVGDSLHQRGKQLVWPVE
jgi:hypothetical protein